MSVLQEIEKYEVYFETLKIGVAAAYCTILVAVVLVILAALQLLLKAASPER